MGSRVSDKYLRQPHVCVPQTTRQSCRCAAAGLPRLAVAGQGCTSMQRSAPVHGRAGPPAARVHEWLCRLHARHQQHLALVAAWRKQGSQRAGCDAATSVPAAAACCLLPPACCRWLLRAQPSPLTCRCTRGPGISSALLGGWCSCAGDSCSICMQSCSKPGEHARGCTYSGARALSTAAQRA